MSHAAVYSSCKNTNIQLDHPHHEHVTKSITLLCFVSSAHVVNYLQKSPFKCCGIWNMNIYWTRNVLYFVYILSKNLSFESLVGI